MLNTSFRGGKSMKTDLYKFEKPGDLLYAVQELKKSHPNLAILPLSDGLV